MMTIIRIGDEETGLPYSTDSDDPLIFHVLTTYDQLQEPIIDLLRSGASLVPRADVVDGWEGADKSGLILPLDEAIGDDRYIFTSPCDIFDDARRSVGPAVAFRLSTVLKHARKVAFRPQDIERLLSVVQEILDPYGEAGLHDFEFDEDDTDITEKMARARADALGDILSEVAWCYTAKDESAVQLVQLYALKANAIREAFELAPTHLSMAQQDLEADLALVRAKMVELMPVCDRDELAQLLGTWSALDNLDEAWAFAFSSGISATGWRQTLAAAAVQPPGGRRWFDKTTPWPRPELLVSGHLPLCDAVFYRTREDDEPAWLPVPVEVCHEGHRARELHPNRMLTSSPP